MRVPPLGAINAPGVLSPLSTASGGVFQGLNAPFGTATAYPTASLAIFFPLVLNDIVTFSKGGWLNGATVSGNVDIGVYDKALNKLVTAGSTAQSGTSTFQSVSVTSTTLNPDLYWLAFACDNATGTFQAAAQGTPMLRTMGVQIETSAFPLPSTITLANPASAYCPYWAFGLGGTF